MSEGRTVYFGGPVHDGQVMHEGCALYVADGRVLGIEADTELKSGFAPIPLNGRTVCPGFVDLQVNGGDGVMFNDDPTHATLMRIAAAHRRLGTAWILPTLITDRPETTTQAIAAATEAVVAGSPGIAGLHLEGPHLSVARKGAHDPDLIRPMQDRDLDELIRAAAGLPALMVTIAPENVSTEQVRALADAGIVVSLGHTDATYEACLEYARAGACCVTHLFNAMSQIGNRAPGCVGAALGEGALSAGLIADGVHVHPANITTAMSAKVGPGQVFLVSDAMAPAGTDQTNFELNGRQITRRDGRLTLADGTLAGADLSLDHAVSVMVHSAGIPAEHAISMATSIPAGLAGLGAGAGQLKVGGPADIAILDL